MKHFPIVSFEKFWWFLFNVISDSLIRLENNALSDQLRQILLTEVRQIQLPARKSTYFELKYQDEVLEQQAQLKDKINSNFANSTVYIIVFYYYLWPPRGFRPKNWLASTSIFWASQICVSFSYDKYIKTKPLKYLNGHNRKR